MRLRDLLSAATAALFAAALFASPAARWLEGLSLDVLFGSRKLIEADQVPPPSETVIIALDEETYRQLPFSEKPSAMWLPEIGKVTEALLDAEAAAIGFDIVFPMSLQAQLPGFERPFLLALRRGAREERIVLGRVQHQSKPIEPSPGQRVAVGLDRNIRLLNALEDSDGIIRRAPLAFTWREPDGTAQQQSSFAMELAARKLQQQPDWQGDETLSLNGRPVRLAEEQSALLNFDTRPGAIPVYSLADLHACAEQSRQDYFAQHFRNKVILIGVTLDVEDRKLTSMRLATHPEGQNLPPRCALPPRAEVYNTDTTRDSIPGVYLHATAVNNLLRGDELLSPRIEIRAACLLLLSALATFALLRYSALRAGLIFLSLAALWTAGCMLAFMLDVALPLLNGLAAATLSVALMLAYRFTIADRDKRAIRQAFALYLPSPVIDRMMAEDRPPELGGEERVVSVLFSDIAGFTKASETLTPSELTRGLNKYFSAMTDIVEDHGGFVDKFVGDAIIAVFGAPVSDSKHAEHAVRAALHMDRVMRSGHLQLSEDAPIHTRVGVHTGPVLIGNIGSPRRFNYTVMGDAVNLASRLEGANKGFGTRLLVSDATREACGEEILFRQIDVVRVVGRETAVGLFEPLARAGRDDMDYRIATLPQFTEALALWQAGQFAEAEILFARLGQIDPVAMKFAIRCRKHLEHPPARWTGITGLTEK